MLEISTQGRMAHFLRHKHEWLRFSRSRGLAGPRPVVVLSRTPSQDLTNSLVRTIVGNKTVVVMSLAFNLNQYREPETLTGTCRYLYECNCHKLGLVVLHGKPSKCWGRNVTDLLGERSCDKGIAELLWEDIGEPRSYAIGIKIAYGE